MSSADTKAHLEDTFASKLGIEMVTPRIFKDLIQLNAGTKNVVCAIGPSGIGKTAIPHQVAAERNGGKGVPYAQVHMPTATQEGFFIPTMAKDTQKYFDQRIPRTFEEVLGYAEEMEKKHKGKVPKDLCPIIVVEELNRAVDKSVTRAAFVLIGDRMIGDTRVPNCVQFVVTMNPSGGGMAVNEFEKDPAMSRRLLKIGVDYNYGDFIQYAQSAKFHPSVLGHLGAQVSHGYDKEAALASKAFACPATWEVVSRLCYEFDTANLQMTTPIGRAAVAGAIGTAAATAFLDYVRDNTLVVTPEDVLSQYAAANSEIRRRFKAYLTDDGGRLDKVTELTNGLAIHTLVDMKRKPESISKPLALFMSDLPVEIMMAFIQRLTDESQRVGNDGKTYLASINREMAKEQAFNDAMKKLHDAKQKVGQETKGK